MRKISFSALVVAGAVLLGCHTITEELPTQPTAAEEQPSSGVLTVAIPALTVTGTPTPASTPAPTASPTPTPVPGTPPPANPTPPPAPPPPEPTPEPPPSGGRGGCGKPLPPDIQLVKAKVHFKGGKKWTLDSTALVAGYEYCREIGFTDGRNRCPVRPEGHPEREACEAYAIGKAQDTRRPGPTWDRNGELCDGIVCENHPDNQHLLLAYEEGRYHACAKNGVCGTVKVE